MTRHHEERGDRFHRLRQDMRELRKALLAQRTSWQALADELHARHRPQAA